MQVSVNRPIGLWHSWSQAGERKRARVICGKEEDEVQGVDARSAQDYGSQVSGVQVPLVEISWPCGIGGEGAVEKSSYYCTADVACLPCFAVPDVRQIDVFSERVEDTGSCDSRAYCRENGRGSWRR